ncbi:nicotinamide-nucleotide amidase [Hymenobacter daecheongensis DSM 21074]|uniref:Nicotinamide-nucleotide amidase n=1 Tax=Hymenobacter daecheongensis DSM 21074 TaxID=1121955 RepID=A0A1M6G536_9BACT|nr:nicotinamide-nucleotide amidohydrolase family protein [Hymenobacter daecheongensis]SHJ05044.1 nicotinamide-nucleotide amidase [Hymenobacter daecheongensis DSM 21074]
MKTTDLNALIKQFLQQKLSLALAESCTCGLVAAQLAPTEGIGEVLLGSVVTYQAEAKQRLLGVKKKTLLEYSAESQQTTNEMVQGLHRLLPTADVCVAVTGLFGAGASEQQQKPVGTIFVTILFEGRAHEYREELKGSPEKFGALAADFIYGQLAHLLRQRQELALNTPLSTAKA